MCMYVHIDSQQDSNLRIVLLDAHFARVSLVCAYLSSADVVYFKHGDHSVREDNVNGIPIELLLAEPARSHRRINVYAQRSGDTAKAGKLL